MINEHQVTTIWDTTKGWDTQNREKVHLFGLAAKIRINSRIPTKSWSVSERHKSKHHHWLVIFSSKSFVSHFISSILLFLPAPYNFSWKKSYDKPRHHLKAETSLCHQRSLYSNLRFFSSHVWMWELDPKESWAPKNWCFWTVMLEKTLESLLELQGDPTSPS